MLIKSHIANLALRERQLVSLVPQYSPTEGDVAVISEEDLPDAGAVDGESVLQEIFTKEFLELCQKSLEGDDTMGIVFLEMAEEKTKKEIAENLGLTVSDVENIKKRIMRKLLPPYIKYRAALHTKDDAAKCRVVVLPNKAIRK